MEQKLRMGKSKIIIKKNLTKRKKTEQPEGCSVN